MSSVSSSSNFITRIGDFLRYQVSAKKTSWFGPNTPPAPQAPKQVAGRAFDFPVGINLHNRPRQACDGVSFNELRALADHYDLLRLVIETRKDQLSKMTWSIQPKNPAQKKDKRCEAIEAFFAFPDKEHSWDEWLRMLIEDLLVIDAPTLYVRKTNKGDLWALEPIDGATIKRVLDENGRTPAAPCVAYQQILKGVVALNYTQNDLIYRPRNLRTHKVYGFSPVEQIMMTVNIALRRQLHQLEYYRSGSVPDALAGVPTDWQPEQIQQYQAYWDALMEGDNAARRRVKFVPGELAQNFKEIKQPPLKDLYDEWLARIVCFAFSIEPTSFVSQTNRAVAQTLREQSLSEGLAPLQNWIKNLIDHILANHLDSRDLAFGWVTEEAIDPMVQAQIHALYFNAGVLSSDDIRQHLGLGKKPSEPAHTPTHTAEKLLQKGHIAPIPKSRPMLDKAEKALAQRVSLFLHQQALYLKAMVKQTPLQQVSDKIANWLFRQPESFYDATVSILTDVSMNGGTEALSQIGKLDDNLSNKLRECAAKWAKDRSAEMVGMKWLKGQLVPNPDAKWAITESTRDLLRALTTQALEEGLSTDSLANMIEHHEAFGKARARVIARTEIAKADTAGAMASYRLSQIVTHKRWLSANDDAVSAECAECEAAGAILLDEDFPSGVDAPPNHPNCRCAVLPVLDDED